MKLNIRFHEAQLAVLHDKARWKVFVAGRRVGKSYMGLHLLLLAVLGFKGVFDPVSPVVVLAALPTLKQARKIIWEPLLALLEDCPLVKHINRTDFRIDFYNKPSIMVVGANDNNGDRIRGLKLYYAWFDESQDVLPSIFDTVIQPALADTLDSTCLLTGTPKGRTNWLYKFVHEYPGISYHNYPTSVNPTIPRESLELLKKTLSPRLYRQEILGSWEDFSGKVFNELDTTNIVQSFTHLKDSVFIGVDFGDINPAVAVWARDEANRFCYLDGWINDTDEPVTQVNVFKVIDSFISLYGVNGVFCDPSRPAAIMELKRRYFNQLAVSKGYNRVEDGVAQVESMVYTKSLLFLDATQKQQLAGTEAYKLFESYRRDEVNNITTDSIAQRQDDHIIDASRYVLATKYGSIV